MCSQQIHLRNRREINRLRISCKRIFKKKGGGREKKRGTSQSVSLSGRRDDLSSLKDKMLKVSID